MADTPIQARTALGQIAPSHQDLPIGKVYGRLTVIGNERREGKNYVVDCRCDCGAFVSCRVGELKIGKKLQCGAHKRQVTERQRRTTAERNRTHGMSRRPEYNAWIGMKVRCNNPNNSRYADYGGRGIKVCPEWENDFEAFYAFMGPRPKGCTLDRINVDGDYEPSNVRWTNASQQMRNRRPFLVRPGKARREERPTPAYIRPNFSQGGHANTRHGMTGTPEYQAWRAMKKRCLDPHNPAYGNYGGRGVTIHPDWIDDFSAFLLEVGMRPEGGYSLDRIDNSRGYEPGNVRWADAYTQNRNRRPFVMMARSL